MSTLPLLETPSMGLQVSENLKILHSRPNHDKALLYLHGFPGPYEKLTSGELRIADQAFPLISKSYDMYYPLYTMRDNEDLSFQQTLKDGEIALSFLTSQKKYSSVTLVGQSWGAVIALDLSRRFSFQKMILLTPFLVVPTGDAAKQILNGYSANFPELIAEQRIVALGLEIDNIAVKHNPLDALKQTSSPTTIIAAEADEAVPFGAVVAMAKQTPGVKLIALPEQSHKIENRKELLSVLHDELCS